MRKFTSIAAAIALCAGGSVGVILSAPSEATITPKAMAPSDASGTNLSLITLVTVGQCASGDKIQVSITGNGFPGVGYGMTGKDKTEDKVSGSNYSLDLLETMASAALAQNPVATLSGWYTFTANCYQGLAPTVLDSFQSRIYFTDATHWTQPISTTTTVSSTPQSITDGDSVTLTSRITPSNATGSVEFFYTPVGGAKTSLGTATVSGGVATKEITSGLPAGDAGAYVRSYFAAAFTGTGAYADSATAPSFTGSAVDVRGAGNPPQGGGAVKAAIGGGPTGTKGSSFSFDWTDDCPTNNVNTKYQLFVLGDGFPLNGYAMGGLTSAEVATITVGQLRLDAAETMTEAAAAQSPPAVIASGNRYDFEVRCFSRNDGQGIGYQRPIAVVASGSMWFTTSTAWQNTSPQVGPVNTTLTLSASSLAPKANQPVDYTATVAPSDAVGSVTFTATAFVGGSEIVLGTDAVSNGVATVRHALGTNGSVVAQYTISAVFTPTDANSFVDSSDSQTATVSAETLINSVKPTLSAAKVGAASTCSVGTWVGATKYNLVLKVGTGTVASKTDQVAGATVSYTPVAADVAKSLSCTVTAIAQYGATKDVSATAVAIAQGNAPSNTVAPKISGALSVGGTLKVTTGTWSLSGVTYSYQWVKYSGTNATNIANANSASYKIAAAMKGLTLGVVVTAAKSGYKSGAVTIKTSGSVK